MTNFIINSNEIIYVLHNIINVILIQLLLCFIVLILKNIILEIFENYI